MDITNLPFAIMIRIYFYLSIEDVTRTYRVNKLFNECFKTYISDNEYEVSMYQEELENTQLYEFLHPDVVYR